jgi:hypothetical protein
MPFAQDVVSTLGALVRQAIKSPNYVAGVSGWSINKDGTAEFGNATIRGGVIAGPSSSQVIIGPAANLPAPLNTYLLAGIVWVANTRMSYIGLRNIAGTITTEQGFVTNTNTIVPNAQFVQNGGGAEYNFVGVTDVRFQNTGGTYVAPTVVGTPFGIMAANVTFYEDTFNTWIGAINTLVDRAIRDNTTSADTYTHWNVTYDSTSTLKIGCNYQWGATASVSASDAQAALQSPTLTTFVLTGTTCGVAFVAPPSGIVQIAYGAFQAHSAAAGFSITSPQIAAGSSVGAGAVFYAANDDECVQVTGTNGFNQGSAFRLSGLTAGSAYNVALYTRVSGATGSLRRRRVMVAPIL